jgi:hypothetical protein
MQTKYLNRTSLNENVRPAPRMGCGHLGRITTIVGVLAFLIMNNGPLGVANSRPAAGETAGQGVATVNSETTEAVVFSKNQPERTAQSHNDSVQQANSVQLRRESGYVPLLALGNMQAGAGRCHRNNVCHYSMALMETASRETQTAGPSEVEATVSFDPICAAQDLDATTRIEELGINEKVSSDKLATAGLMLMTARANCAHGRIVEALEQYEKLLVHTLASAEAK